MQRLLVGFICIAFNIVIRSISARKAHPIKTLIADGYIVGGMDTDISEIPYLVSFELSGRHYCGAAVISENFALTAAHCVDRTNLPNLALRAGTTYKEKGGTLYSISAYYMHPKFVPSNLDYDIAVLKTTTPIRFDDKTQPTLIASREPQKGDRGLIAGWGRHDYPIKMKGRKRPYLPHPDGLKYATVTFKEWATCKEKLNPRHKFTKRMICAGGEGKDICKGDSGGPIAVNGITVGISSWAIVCGTTGYPGAYTSIAHQEIRSFIRDITNI